MELYCDFGDCGYATDAAKLPRLSQVAAEVV